MFKVSPYPLSFDERTVLVLMIIDQSTKTEKRDTSQAGSEHGGVTSQWRWRRSCTARIDGQLWRSGILVDEIGGSCCLRMNIKQGEEC